VKIQKIAGRWAFHVYTDEDYSYLVSKLPDPTSLEEYPRVLALLRGAPEREAENRWMQEHIIRPHGGPSKGVEAGHASVELLIRSARNLQRHLLKVVSHLRESE
jgi:hypothetical protein